MNDKYYDFLERGGKKYHIGDFAGAIADYSKAIEFNSEYAEVYFWRGMAKFYLSDKKGACLDFRTAGNMGNITALECIRSLCQ